MGGWVGGVFEGVLLLALVAYIKASCISCPERTRPCRSTLKK